jgi:hypothetical protein
MPAIDSSLRVSACPSGHVASAEDSLIGRVTWNVLSQVRHRYS